MSRAPRGMDRQDTDQSPQPQGWSGLSVINSPASSQVTMPSTDKKSITCIGLLQHSISQLTDKPNLLYLGEGQLTGSDPAIVGIP